MKIKVLVFLISIAFVIIFIEMYYARQITKGLPIVSINTSTQLLHSRYWHMGDITVVNNLNRRDNVYYVQARFRPRGNSTFRQEKMPFNVNFELPVSIAGFYPQTHFIFLAEYFDPSLMRNFTALHLASAMTGMLYTPYTRHVSMYINGEYQGVYLLTEHRTRIIESSTYVIELNHVAPDRSEKMNIDWIRANNRYYMIRHQEGNMTEERGIDLSNFLIRASNAITSQNFNLVQQYFDIDSLVDFYILRELFASHDTGMFSVFMQIIDNEEGRRIYMGPVWDFDVSAGIVNQISYIPWQEQNWVSLPEGLALAEFNYWFRNLIQIPEFVRAIRPRLDYMKEYALPNTIKEMWRVFETYQYDFDRNFSLHPINHPEHAHSVESFQKLSDQRSHIIFLENFLTTRADWLSNLFSDYLPELYFPRMYGQIDVFLNGVYIDFASHIESSRFINEKPHIQSRWLFSTLFPEYSFNQVRSKVSHFYMPFVNWFYFINIDVLDYLGIDYEFYDETIYIFP